MKVLEVNHQDNNKLHGTQLVCKLEITLIQRIYKCARSEIPSYFYRQMLATKIYFGMNSAGDVVNETMISDSFNRKIKIKIS